MKYMCVYCGSREGNQSVYAEAAVQLGQALAKQGLGLVYGGANIGLMGLLANAALAAGTEVIGVIPSSLMENEVAHPGLTKLVQVPDMHQRKAMMEQLSDGFIALPGGYGTLEELIEMLTWAQLRLHAKPCGLLNIAGYYDSLIAFFDRAEADELLASANRELLLVDSEIDGLLTQMRPLI